MIHKCLMGRRVPGQPGLFISRHHVWLPEQHSCPKYLTCLKMVEITSSVGVIPSFPQQRTTPPARSLYRIKASDCGLPRFIA